MCHYLWWHFCRPLATPELALIKSKVYTTHCFARVNVGVADVGTIMVPCAVKMPFYNATTYDITYEAFDMGIVGDDSSIVSTLNNELCQLAWENQCNPDWQIVGDNSHTSSLSGQQGTGSVQCNAGPILRAVIQLNLQNSADINKW